MCLKWGVLKVVLPERGVNGLPWGKLYLENHGFAVGITEGYRMRKGMAKTAEVELTDEPANTEAYSSVCNNL